MQLPDDAMTMISNGMIFWQNSRNSVKLINSFKNEDYVVQQTSANRLDVDDKMKTEWWGRKDEDRNIADDKMRTEKMQMTKWGRKDADGKNADDKMRTEIMRMTNWGRTDEDGKMRTRKHRRKHRNTEAGPMRTEKFGWNNADNKIRMALNGDG